ncbi:KdsC family phosphatase [Lutibacter flavus]|uniref:3-deoxy-D-manno-octulosonate 8-phosphate phosphatase (KDO 8-P phosphatase) n=1 Tax=Lutibacter flavus TaxID=691689 RepID=A0A238VJE9_9FLAO|nr:HAD-IIIA family hydrolase [Lutibacter flavus]SNR33629.1 3-deoxy-D-manno-octulosonate 8-phosphate phosphatase (KDO 8-P phosphatase) [Lutibacter flavus]
MGKSYKEIMPQITTFMFDVDGVLTNGMITITTTGELIRTMNIKDGYALKTAIDQGFKICIISGGSNEGVRSRLQNLGITDIYLGTHNKMEQFEEYITIHKLNPEEILFMGDDIPDYKVMKKVGLPSCPKDAVPEIQDISLYISQKKGGNGCVRDVIEQVLKVQGKWNGQFDAKYD